MLDFFRRIAVTPTIASLRRGLEARAEIAALTAQLDCLRAILDNLDHGIVLIDRERRAQFINRAFRRMWRLPDEIADSRETFVKLMYHGRGAETYAASHDRLGAYVAEQLALIRTGEERPLDIRLADGQVLQFRCKALPGGGRLLTYGNVSELSRRADALEELATHDGMTGLSNRRHFMTLAEGEWARFRRYGRPFALLMFDIDHFKSINDRFGHDVGDVVLKAVADVLRTGKRSSDVAGRIGGEEFALMLPETMLENACAVAERLRQKIAGLAPEVDGRAIPVTVSIGASAARPDAGGIEALLKEADVALYEAKHSGRNRVCACEQAKAERALKADAPSAV